MHTTYILYSESIDTYYVGSTGNLTDRVNRHNGGRSTYTKRGIPWKVVYEAHYATKAEACQAELHIKAQKSRTFIEILIARTKE